MLDSLYGTNKSYLLLQQVLNKLGSEDAFFKEYNRVKDVIINTISESDAYKQLGSDSLGEYITKRLYPNTDVYNMNNIENICFS
ncbi:hypothetical protein [uncultured Arcobacter sp.]|uniref:hypothetical protein n=1 Tax=uncultured Arcobacter sp. TaxID=165434 RepID=UPI00262A59E8|nr:hypothetical protein [uncultured Arcobacter sp.]